MKKIIPFTSKNFPQITNHFKKGKIVILPTDTILGISADPTNLEAIEEIQKLKNRVSLKPFLLLAGKIETVLKYTNISSKQKKIIDQIWPAPCTILLPRQNEKETELKIFFPKQQYLAFRIPDYPEMLDFLNNYWKKPLISTSANISGEPHLNNLKDLQQKFQDYKQLIFSEDFKKSDQLKNTSQPSTIIKITDKEIKIIRDGIIPKNKIEQLATKFL